MRNEANDILAVCYLKELQNSGIEPVLIPRTTNYLDETADGPVASAMAIRRMLKDLHDVSAYTPMAEQSSLPKPMFPQWNRCGRICGCFC